MGVARENAIVAEVKRGTSGAPEGLLLAGFVQPAIKWRFWHRAIEHVDHFAIFEHHNGRDAADTKPGAKLTFRFGVDFHKTHLPATLFRDIFKDRREATAGAAPWRPEIDNDRQIVL